MTINTKRALIALTTVAAVMVSGAQANAQVGKVIGWGVGALVGKAIGKGGREPTYAEKVNYVRTHRAEMDSAIDKVIANELIPTFPKRMPVDGETLKMTNVVREGSTITYVYTMDDEYLVATPAVRAEAKVLGAPKVCSMEDMKLLMEGGYTFTYLYYNPDQKTAFLDYSVTVADCR